MSGCNARIIAVGDELLEGRTADTNSQRIQQALGRHAVQMLGIEVVPDTHAAIGAALERTRPGELVFLSGGLGSTPDDLTRDAVTAWAGVALDEDPALRQRLEQRWIKRGIRMPVGVNRQAQVPAGLTWLENPVGAAPALVGELCDRIVVLLPGVPSELTALLPLVVAWLGERDLLPAQRPMRLWRTAQAAETTLVRKCEALREQYGQFDWSWWLTDWGVDMRVTAAAGTGEVAEAILDDLSVRVDTVLGQLVYTREMVSLPETVQQLMIERGLTLAVAESCTAGLIGGALTQAAGSSDFFLGGVIAYADRIKQDLLGVDERLLRDHGAVSEPVVTAMAAGARERLGADYAIAVSGISGPGGGSDDKPVGTTWTAVVTPETVYARCYRFPANRSRNRRLTVAAALDNLRRVLTTQPGQELWPDEDLWCPVQPKTSS